MNGLRSRKQQKYVDVIKQTTAFSVFFQLSFFSVSSILEKILKTQEPLFNTKLHTKDQIVTRRFNWKFTYMN